MKKCVISLILILMVLSMGLVSACQKNYSGPPETITLGGLNSDANLVFLVAENQHYFTQNGINFNFQTYETGPAVEADLLNNKIDIAGTAEYPVVTSALANNSISVITSISQSYVVALVALNDEGITDISDLKGKKIGVTLGSILEFYLGRFLNLNGMSLGDVTLVNTAPAQDAVAIANGSVDAVVTYQPYENQLFEQYPSGTVSWPLQSGQAVFSVLTCRDDWIQQNPELIERFLKSLAQSETFIAEHPTQAKAILQQTYNYDSSYVNTVWPDYQFSLSLEESLIAAMEDEARWTISNNLTTSSQVPNFLNFIYTNGLEAVEPDSVNIIK